MDVEGEWGGEKYSQFFGIYRKVTKGWVPLMEAKLFCVKTGLDTFIGQDFKFSH